MRAFGKMALMQTKLYLREPMSIFFTLLFGPMLLIIMGLIFGDAPQPALTGLSQMEVIVPAYLALIIGITGLTSVPIGVVTRRESGVLRRFSATSLRPFVYFLADILAPFIVMLVGILLLVLMGIFIYQVRFEGQWLSITAAVCLSTLSFFAIGYALAGLVPSTRVAIVLGNILIIPMNIFSGALIPVEVMPETITNISRFIPLTYVVTLIRGLWYGNHWGDHLMEVIVLGSLLIVSTVIIILTFKWE